MFGKKRVRFRPPGLKPTTKVGTLGPYRGRLGLAVQVAREGAEREVVWRSSGTADLHPTPEDASANGCGWPVALEIPTGDWRSAYYSVTLTAGAERADAFLVVRPGAQRAPMLLVLSTTTWQAYNDWGGASLDVNGTPGSFPRPVPT